MRRRLTATSRAAARPGPPSSCRSSKPSTYRQPHDEAGAAALAAALRLHGSRMQVDQMAHDRQPQPDAAVPPADGAILLAEALEDVRQELRLDALAGVRDTDLHLI